MVEPTVTGLGLIETILLILIPLGTAIGFWVRLEMRVRSVESRIKQLEENPILLALKHIEQDAAINMFSDYLKKTLEKKNE